MRNALRKRADILYKRLFKLRKLIANNACHKLTMLNQRL